MDNAGVAIVSPSLRVNRVLICCPARRVSSQRPVYAALAGRVSFETQDGSQLPDGVKFDVEACAVFVGKGQTDLQERWG